jgi:hypothetical protein
MVKSTFINLAKFKNDNGPPDYQGAPAPVSYSSGEYSAGNFTFQLAEQDIKFVNILVRNGSETG